MADAFTVPLVRLSVPRVPDVGYAMAALAATGLAVVAARATQLPVESDLGLVAALPPTYWAGLVMLNVVFAVVLRSKRCNPGVLALLLGGLVVSIYGAAAIASGQVRTEVAWRHVGVVSTMLSSGQIDPRIDAYFNWPGFFGGLGLVIEATGVSPFALALWAPVWNMLLWLCALTIVVRALTTDPRRRWLSLWLFTLGNWIDQDYLSPQAFAFFLYLVVLGLLLTLLASKSTITLLPSLRMTGIIAGTRVWWNHREPLNSRPRLRAAALLVVVLLASVIIASHQLTPFVLLVSVVGLVVAGRCWPSGLPVILVVIVVTWLTYGASAYLAGHPVLLSEGVDAAAGANVSDRLDGSPGHVAVVQIRMATTAVLWAVAAVGFVRTRKRGRHEVEAVILATMPFVLFPFQSYGGEMLLRVTLFALPFTAYLAAAAFLPDRQSNGRRVIATVIMFCVLLTLGTITSRFGNAGFDMFTQDEIEASERLYALAPAGALLIAGSHPTPWRYREYAEHKTTTVQDICSPRDDARTCHGLLRARALYKDAGAMVMLSRANRESMRLQGLMAPETFDRTEQLLRRGAGVSLVFQNRDARIYRITR